MKIGDKVYMCDIQYVYHGTITEVDEWNKRYLRVDWEVPGRDLKFYSYVQAGDVYSSPKEAAYQKLDIIQRELDRAKGQVQAYTKDLEVVRGLYESVCEE